MTCLISAAFGLGLGACDSYTSFLVVTAFCGFGIGGNIPIDTTICLEFLPQNRRFLLVLLSFFQPIGVVICSVIAYGFIPPYSCSPNFVEPNPAPSCRDVPTGTPCCTRASNMGWRYLMFTLGAITLSIFFLRFVVFNFQESPKFLVYRGKDQKAIEVLQKIAKFNKRQSSLTIEDFSSLRVESADHSAAGLLGAGDEQETLSFWGKFKLEFSRYGMLFSSKSATYLTILVWLTCRSLSCCMISFTLTIDRHHGFLGLHSSRRLPSQYHRRKERCDQPRLEAHIPLVCLHLSSRHCRCPLRRCHVQSSCYWS